VKLASLFCSGHSMVIFTSRWTKRQYNKRPFNNFTSKDAAIRCTTSSWSLSSLHNWTKLEVPKQSRVVSNHGGPKRRAPSDSPLKKLENVAILLAGCNGRYRFGWKSHTLSSLHPPSYSKDVSLCHFMSPSMSAQFC